MITEKQKSLLKNKRSFTLEAPFIKACADNNLELVKYILFSEELNQHPDVSCRNYQCIREAARQGAFEVVEFLLTSPLVNKTEELIKARKQVLIRNACSSGNLKLVRYLLETPGIKEYIDFSIDKYKPFEQAVHSLNPELTVYLYEKYKLTMKEKYTYLNNFFTQIYREGYMDCAKKLLEHKEIANYFICSDKSTALTQLLRQNKKEDIDFLFKEKRFETSIKQALDYGSVMVALTKTDSDILHLIIVEKNIELSETLQEFLDNPNHDTINMRKMFENRELYKKLSDKYENLPKEKKNKI